MPTPPRTPVVVVPRKPRSNPKSYNLLGILLLTIIVVVGVVVIGSRLIPGKTDVITVCQEPTHRLDQSSQVPGDDWEKAVGVENPGPGFFKVYRFWLFNDVHHIEMMDREAIC